MPAIIHERLQRVMPVRTRSGTEEQIYIDLEGNVSGKRISAIDACALAVLIPHILPKHITDDARAIIARVEELIAAMPSS